MVAAVCWNLVPLLLHGQTSYTAGQFPPAHFQKTSTTRITSEIANHTRHERVALDGRVWIMAHDTAGGLAIEAWFDSLAIRRETEEGQVSPETDGVIGGRYHGVLTVTGQYRREAVPFVPDEIAEIVNLEASLDDLLPVLPPAGLHPNEAWSDSSGLRITRLPDSLIGSAPVQRYRTALHVPERRVPGSDSTGLESLQEETEQGTFLWSPGVGLTRRERDIVIQTYVPAGNGMRQSVRVTVAQHVVLQRLVR